MYCYSILEFFHAIAIIPIQVLLLCSYCAHFITNCDTVVCLSPAPSRSECHCPHAGHCFTHFSMLGELSPPYWLADMWRFVHVPYNRLKPSLRPVAQCQHDCTFLFFSAFGVGSFGCRSGRETKRSCLRSEGCSLITEDTWILIQISIMIMINAHINADTDTDPDIHTSRRLPVTGWTFLRKQLQFLLISEHEWAVYQRQTHHFIFANSWIRKRHVGKIELWGYFRGICSWSKTANIKCMKYLTQRNCWLCHRKILLSNNEWHVWLSDGYEELAIEFCVRGYHVYNIHSSCQQLSGKS